MLKNDNKYKSISFTKKDFDVYQFLMTKINASNYIISLIRKDMENKVDIDLKEMVKELIREELNKGQKNNSNIEVIGDNVVSSINDLLGF
ncbi:MAG TPA: hypothetical protein VIK86_08140 [Candidatus Paceibacterota bacterium]